MGKDETTCEWSREDRVLPRLPHTVEKVYDSNPRGTTQARRSDAWWTMCGDDVPTHSRYPRIVLQRDDSCGGEQSHDVRGMERALCFEVCCILEARATAEASGSDTSRNNSDSDGSSSADGSRRLRPGSDSMPASSANSDNPCGGQSIRVCSAINKPIGHAEPPSTNLVNSQPQQSDVGLWPPNSDHCASSLSEKLTILHGPTLQEKLGRQAPLIGCIGVHSYGNKWTPDITGSLAGRQLRTLYLCDDAVWTDDKPPDNEITEKVVLYQSLVNFETSLGAWDDHAEDAEEHGTLVTLPKEHFKLIKKNMARSDGGNFPTSLTGDNPAQTPGKRRRVAKEPIIRTKTLEEENSS